MGVLGYKDLKVGQVVLGVVKAVNDFDMAVSLPNQLTGFVSCDRISATLRERLATAADSAAAGGVPEVPGLDQFYQPGEPVVATIVSLTSPIPHGTGTRRRIGLSLLPEEVNKGIPVDAILADMMLAGEVCSHEDRGYTIKLGLKSPKGKKGRAAAAAGTELLGFLPDTAVSTELREGKTLPLLVAASFDNKASRVITLTADPDAVAQATFKNQAHVESLTCGTQVSVAVTTAAPGSIGVSVLGHAGTIDIFNLPDGVMLRRQKELELAEHFPTGKHLPARIALLDREERTIWLTCKSGLLAWRPAVNSGRLGQRVEEVRVCRVDPKTGLLIAMEEPQTQQLSHAYVHISRLSNERVESVEGCAKYKVGTKHRARLIDYDAFSGTYLASLKESDVGAAILNVADLHPGQTVRGEVLRKEAFGVIVSITERVRAICPIAQLTELQGEQALKTYTVGQKYKFRVLDCDPATRRITLTRKKGLLDSQLPVLSQWDQLAPGNQHDGYIVALRDFGCIVRFFGEVKGIVTVAEMSDEYVDRPQDSYFLGQVVRCRVLKYDTEAKELKLTLRKTSGPKALPAGFKRPSAIDQPQPEEETMPTKTASLEKRPKMVEGEALTA